jgi:hypothetical protein
MEDLANAVVESAGQPATVRVGLVESTSPLRITISGAVIDPAALGVIPTYNPVVGDPVCLLGQSVDGADTSASTWVALGCIAPSGEGLNDNGLQFAPAALSNNTFTYNSITGLVFPWTKRRTQSRVYVHFAGSSFALGAANVHEFAGQLIDTTGVLASVDHVIARFFQNNTGEHHSWSGFRFLPGGLVPAGSYLVQGRFRLVNILAGSANLNGDDLLSLRFKEVD